MSQTLTQHIDIINQIINKLYVGLSCNNQWMRNQYAMQANALRKTLDNSAFSNLDGIGTTLSNIATSLSALENSDTSFAAQLATLNASLTSLSAQVAAKKSVVSLPDVTVPASALITLTVGEKTVTRQCVGLKTTDTLLLTVKTMGANYGLRGYSIAANDSVIIKLQCPILTVGGSDIVFSAIAFR